MRRHKLVFAAMIALLFAATVQAQQAQQPSQAPKPDILQLISVLSAVQAQDPALQAQPQAPPAPPPPGGRGRGQRNGGPAAPGTAATPDSVNETRATVAQAEAQLAARRADFNRATQLFKDAVITQQQLDAAQAALRSAEAARDAANQRLALQAPPARGGQRNSGPTAPGTNPDLLNEIRTIIGPGNLPVLNTAPQGGNTTVSNGRSLLVNPASGAWWTNAELTARLGLTDDQKMRIERAFENHRQNLTASKDTLVREEAQLSRLLDTETLDRPGITAQINKVVQARGEMEKINALMTLEMREVLTRAQWMQLQVQQSVNVTVGVGTPGGRGGARGGGQRGGAPGGNAAPAGTVGGRGTQQ